MSNKDNGLFGQILVPVVVALLVGGTTPWWLKINHSPVPTPSPVPTALPVPMSSPVSTASPPATFSTPQPQPSPSPQLTAQAFYDSGNSKYSLKDYTGAITDYNQAINLKPDFAEAHNSRGNCKYYLKDYQGAIADYNQAINLNPNNADAYYNNRGNSKRQLGDYQGAIIDYDQAINLNPNNADAYYNRGLSHKFVGYSPNGNDFLQARKLYQQQNNQTGYQNSLDRLKELNIWPPDVPYGK